MNSISVQISYHPQRTSTARLRNGKIHLRISSLVSRRQQEQHIDELLKKMKGREALPRPKTKLSLEDFFGKKLMLSTGVEYDITPRQADSNRHSVEKIGQKLIVRYPVGAWNPGKAEQALLDFLMKDQLPILKQKLDDLAEGWLDERCSRVRMRLSMSRWGSCHKKTRVIMLCAKLLLVQPKLLEYVCVHELAHLKYSDHSDLFWDLISQKMPEWKVQRRRLRKYE